MDVILIIQTLKPYWYWRLVFIILIRHWTFMSLDLGHVYVFPQSKLELFWYHSCVRIKHVSHRQNVTNLLEWVQIIWTRWRQILPPHGMITESLSNSHRFYLFLFCYPGEKSICDFSHCNRTKRTMTDKHNALYVPLETDYVPKHYKHISPLGSCGKCVSLHPLLSPITLTFTPIRKCGERTCNCCSLCLLV